LQEKWGQLFGFPFLYSLCPAVESVPERLSGAWVFKDTRMPVSAVFENIEAGATVEEIMEWFHLSREQIVPVLQFAARSLESPPLHPSYATKEARWQFFDKLMPRLSALPGAEAVGRGLNWRGSRYRIQSGDRRRR